MHRAHAAQAEILAGAKGRPLSLGEVTDLVRLINPTGSRSTGNCLECSWAVRDVLSKRRPAVAGPSGAQKFIEPSSERFSGDSQSEIDAKIRERLVVEGSSGIVSGNRYSDAYGHHYNAANIENKNYFLDGQTGAVDGKNIVSDGDYYVVFPTDP